MGFPVIAASARLDGAIAGTSICTLAARADPTRPGVPPGWGGAPPGLFLRPVEISAYLFDHGVLTAAAQTLAWCVIVFASAAASAAYLTVSEIFPVESAPRRGVPSALSSALAAKGPGAVRPSHKRLMCRSQQQAGD